MTGWQRFFSAVILAATFLAVNLLFIFSALPVRAAGQALIPGEPFAIPFQLSSKSATQTFPVKARFVTPIGTKKQYSGEVWNSQWLGQTDAWTLFPRFTGGSVHHFLTGRIASLLGVTQLEILIQDQDPFATFSLVPYAPQNEIHLRAYDADGVPFQTGYFLIRDGDVARYVPLLQESEVTTLTEQALVGIGYYAESGELAYPITWFQLRGKGAHTLVLHAPAKQLYHPQLKSEGEVRVNMPIILTLDTDVPYRGVVHWYVNGEIQAATNTTFNPTPLVAGRMEVAAILQDSRELVTSVFEVQSLTGVEVDSVLPNPEAGQSESITLRNTHDYPVVVRNWKMTSQATSATVALNGVIDAGATLTIMTTNKLTNSGGTYDIWNESGQLVDAFTYHTAPVGVVLVRDGTRWHFADVPIKPVDIVDPSTGVVTVRKATVPDVSIVVTEAPSGAPDVHMAIPTRVRDFRAFLIPALPTLRFMRWLISLLVSAGVVLILLSRWPQKPV
jgi:hypothetical protein